LSALTGSISRSNPENFFIEEAGGDQVAEAGEPRNR
jgi:hypothetical protein